MSDEQPQDGGLPRDNLIRATFPANLEVRETAGEEPVMDVQFVRYNEWTEINSTFEGNFMERFGPKSLAKTIKENLANIRVLFQHGRDPQIGDKVLGPIKSLKDTETGPRAQVPLYDTSYNRDLLPGLKDGAYGASVRFAVVREDFNRDPGKSEHNPEGLAERTITEAKVLEFGPVTFPAYAGASAGVRALTFEDLERSPLTSQDTPEALKPEEERDPGEMLGDAFADGIKSMTDSESTIEPTQEAAPPHPPETPVRRDTQPDVAKAQTKDKKMANEYKTVEEVDVRLAEIESEQKEIYAEWGVRAFDKETQNRWDEMKEEKVQLERDKAAYEERKAYIEAQIERAKTDSSVIDRGAGSPSVVAKRNAAPENVFDLAEYHNRAASHDHLSRLYKEGAERALDGFTYPNPNVDPAEASKNAKEMLDREDPQNEMAQRLLVHGSPTYRSAFWKTQAKQPLNAEEQRKLHEGMQIEMRALTAATDGGITVPVQIDPTILLSSSGALNPFRQVSRLVRTTSYQWQGVTSAGVTAAYALEGAAMADNTPTLVAPTITPERANVFVPYTWEAAQDWPSLEGEMAALFADSKDILEAAQFAVGAGHASNVPQGVLIGAGTLVGGATSTVGTSDLFRLSDALPARFQPRAVWLATPTLFSKIRQVAGGANTGIWAENLQVGNPPTLLGYPAYKASSVGTAWADLGGGPKYAIIGDFNYFAIVDRIGFQVRQVDTLFNGNTAGGIAYPNGMGGLIGYWRNSSGVLASNAFRTGTVS